MADPVAAVAATNVASILTIVGSISAIAFAVTGLAVWALRSATADMKQNLDETTHLLQADFKEFKESVDNKLDSFHIHVDQKVEGVKTHVRDLSIKSDGLSDKIHGAERDYLLFRSQLGEQYVTRRELDELRKRIIRLEPNPNS
jgi:hypothetical protein